MAKCKNIEDRTDHLGQLFESIEMMCEYWNIASSDYYNRTKRGWSKEKTLTTPPSRNNRSSTIEDRTDHLGQVFDTIGDMCVYWNIALSDYYNRTRRGWSKEKTLTTPSCDNYANIEGRTDHIGNTYSSIKKMCQYWGVVLSGYHERIKKGWTQIESLERSPRISKYMHKNNIKKYYGLQIIEYAYTDDNSMNYAIVSIGGNKEIMSQEEVNSYILEKEKEAYEKGELII